MKEDRLVADMMHYLIKIPDKTTKQTLCVMPVGMRTKPTKWEEIMNRKFWLINGQHSVAASRLMVEPGRGLDESVIKHVRTWYCFIV